MKYKVGDKVRIKNKEWYEDNCNRYGILECGDYEFFEPMNEYCGEVVTITRVDDCYRVNIDKGAFCWTDEMIEGLVEEKSKSGDVLNPIEPKSNANCITQERVDEMSLDKAGQITDFEYEGFAYTLPDGYQFVDENGNVINATKIVLEKKKKEYPKTYEECCKVLGIEGGRLMFNTKDITEYEENLIYKIGKLEHIKVCRDAYWKIAGEEMGLGKPWEPDWDSEYFIPAIIYRSGSIQKVEVQYRNAVFAFPTPEMRDAFYDNFKVEIKSCKKLL